jgi:hypothetical protein
MPDTDLAAIIEEGLPLAEAATPGPLTVKNDVIPLGKTCYVQRVIATSPGKPNGSYPGRPGIVAILHASESFEQYKSLSDDDAALWQFAGTHLKTLLLALAAHRQQVAALAAATLCGTVAFRGDDGSGESIVAIRFDCRTEADEFVKLLESLGASQ